MGSDSRPGPKGGRKTIPLSGEITRRQLAALGLGAGFAASMPLGALLTGSAVAQQGTPRRGGTLVKALSADPASSNPGTTTSVTDTELGSLIYEGVTRIEEDFSVGPDLAESWTVSPDQLTYTFKLVQAKWHDGRDLTSEDVKFTIESVSSKYAARFKAAADLIASVSAPDPRTVVVVLKEPYGPFLFSMSAYGGCAVVPKHVFEGTNILENPASLDKPVGTGPFMLKEWRRGDRLVLERHPNYWRPNRPYLDQIVLKIIPDGGTRVLALKAGEVDYSYFYFFPPSRIPEAQADPKLQLREQAVPQDKVLIWNTRRKPFDDPLVRQAIYRATNMPYIHKVVYQGLGSVMKNHMDSRLAWAHDPGIDLTQMYPFNIEAAKAALEQAGVKAGSGGHRLDVRLAFDSTDTDFGRMSQVLASMWGQAGIKVVFQGTPRNAMLEQVFTNWDFDATLQAYSTGGDPALGVSRLYVSSAIQKRPFLNVSGYSNPEVDKGFEDGARLSETQERGRHYKSVAPILARDLPLFPLWQTASINVASRRVQGKWAWSTGYSHWEDVWIDS
jgi:peptide/nickel transport system substrate-binding protein